MALEASFKGKSVLVTGATRGLGRELVTKLHSFGSQVIALSKTKELLDELEKDFSGIRTICVDIGDWDSTRNALVGLEPVDFIVNNAAYLICKDTMHTTTEDFDRIYAVNVKAVMNVIQVMAGKLIEANRSGSIVNVSSVAAVRASPIIAAYSASKAAMEHMSRNLAFELGPKKIRVNVVEPALIETSMAHDLGLAMSKALGHETYDPYAAFQSITARTPTQTTFMPADQVANTILFILSDLCLQMTGQIVPVDGGYLVS